MAEKNEEIEVQIDEPKEAQQELELVIEEKKEEPVELSANDQAIAELNRKLEEERAARVDAEKRAAEAAQSARARFREHHRGLRDSARTSARCTQRSLRTGGKSDA